jgi:hypothetical protein
MNSPLLLPCEIFSGMSASQIEAEIAAMFLRQDTIDQVLRGDLNSDDYFDLVELQGYDMDFLVEQCSEPQFC